MGFENLDYSTTKKINKNSIQDEIDTQQLQISELTKENLKNLKVTLLKNDSSLIVRDEAGNMIGKLKNNQIIDFNGDKKYIGYQNVSKTFLGIVLENGKIGYVSADYITGDINISSTKELNEEPDVKPIENVNTDIVHEDNSRIIYVPEPITKPNNDIIKNQTKVTEYFDLEESSFNKLNKKLIENGLNLNLIEFLSGYKSYIENELKNCDSKIIEKIKKSIYLKTQELNSIVDERIAWVDEQIEEGDYKTEDRKKEIQNQRWIINSKFNGLFTEINNKVLPSALILNKTPKNSSSDKNEEARKMFDAKLTKNGEFDKTYMSGELIDANTNNWNTYDFDNEKDSEFLKKNDINPLGEIPSFLNEEDYKIEKNAKLYWYGLLAGLIINDLVSFSGVWTIPGFAIGAGYDGIDAFTDEDYGFLFLRNFGLVDENYRAEKGWGDNILASIGIIPGATAALKSMKLKKFVSKLSVEELKVFKEAEEKIDKAIKSSMNLEKNKGVPLEKNKSLQKPKTEETKKNKNIEEKPKERFSLTKGNKFLSINGDLIDYSELPKKTVKKITDGETLEDYIYGIKSETKGGVDFQPLDDYLEMLKKEEDIL